MIRYRNGLKLATLRVELTTEAGRRCQVPQGTPEIVSKLADRGEEALQKIAGTQAAQKLLDALYGMRTRIDELQKRVSGVEALEKRIAELEKRVQKLSKENAKPPARKAPAKPKSSGGSAGAKR
jgi:polyhydroxyalkanoate synthesis regulator phasin